MSEQKTQVPLGPFAEPLHSARPNEVPGCPTGLSDTPETVVVPGRALGVEKLEGRQESGRDGQDEAQQDEPAAGA